MLMLFLIFCFFFSSRRRHTRLTCDWSSDVCSSDLLDGILRRDNHERFAQLVRMAVHCHLVFLHAFEEGGLRLRGGAIDFVRSEERRVGKECRCRWWAVQYIKEVHG